MTTALLVIGIIVIFIVGLVSPHAAGKIQRKTDKEAHWLERLANWCWDPITWWVQGSIELTRKAIDLAAGKGKKTRKKL